MFISVVKLAILPLNSKGIDSLLESASMAAKRTDGFLFVCFMFFLHFSSSEDAACYKHLFQNQPAHSLSLLPSKCKIQKKKKERKENILTQPS